MKMNYLLGREKRKHSLDVQIVREDEFSGRLSNRANFRSILLTIFPFFFFWILIRQKNTLGSVGAVLGIRDILVRIRIRRPIPLTNGSVSLSNSGSDSFLQWLKDAKKIIFFIFFSYNLPTGTFSLKKLFFCKNFVLKFYFASIISVCTTPLWNKGRIPDPYLWPIDPDPQHWHGAWPMQRKSTRSSSSLFLYFSRSGSRWGNFKFFVSLNKALWLF